MFGAMNIDLFVTPQGEAGLVCDSVFPRNVVGVILDAQTRELTLEFEDMDGTYHLNIPVDEGHVPKLLFTQRVYIGIFDHQKLANGFEVPILYLNDPFGSSFGTAAPPVSPRRSVIGFEQFLKRCTFAQGLHRDNLGDEATAHSVLLGVDPRQLDYIPALVRERALTAGLGAPTAHPSSMPRMGGLGSSGGTTQVSRPVRDESAKD